MEPARAANSVPIGVIDRSRAIRDRPRQGVLLRRAHPFSTAANELPASMRDIEDGGREPALMSISGNWEKRRIETFEHLGSIGSQAFARSINNEAVKLILGIPSV
jgi:hypothetical protein